MVSAIRQTVTVQADGTIEVHAPELRAGARAEVIVLIEAADNCPAGSPMESLNALQASLGLTTQVAADWVQAASEERRAFGHRS